MDQVVIELIQQWFRANEISQIDSEIGKIGVCRRRLSTVKASKVLQW
jgi:hypothetical protein